MIRQADTIVVLDDGKVAIAGNYETVSVHPLFRLLVGLPPLPADQAAAAVTSNPTEEDQQKTSDTTQTK
jgi:ABC-type sugar transport system ATPase subunit